MMDLFDQFSEDELLLIPVKNLGLNRQPWTFTRGMKVSREFWDENDDLRAKVEYTYSFSADNRTATPTQRCIQWFKTDDTVGLEKIDVLNFSIKDLQYEHRKIRQGQIDYMISAGLELELISDTVPEPYKSSFIAASQSVETILNHYETQIDHYILRGTQEFEDAVRNETDSTIIALLDLGVRPPDAEFSAGLTIKQTILHQLTGEYNP